MNTPQEEVIVYAWADFDQRNIGGHALPSSMDTYGTEYGWTASDFARASGGTLVNFYTLGINAFVLKTEQDIPLAIRYEKLPDKTEAGSKVFVTGYPADTAVLFRLGDRLIDVGLYGIFDTVKNQRLAEIPTLTDELLDVDSHLIFIANYHDHHSEIRVIDLNEGITSGRFEARPATGRRAERDSYREADGFLNSCYGRRILQPRTFIVQGESFTIANSKMDDWVHVKESNLIDPAGRVLIKGHQFSKYIVDAIGFPAALLESIAPSV